MFQKLYKFTHIVYVFAVFMRVHNNLANTKLKMLKLPLADRLKNISDRPVSTSIFALVLVLLVLGVLDFLNKPAPGDILVEAHGLLMDITLFGVILLWFDKRREKKEKVRNYYEQLDDFRGWKGEEGVLRKVGIIKRLLEMNEPLPSLHRIDLSGGDLRGLSFKKTHLSSAMLSKANMQGTNFQEAYLAGSDLSYAKLDNANFRNANLQDVKFKNSTFFWTNLRGANLSSPTDIMSLTHEQLKKAIIDKDTTLPDELLPYRDEILLTSLENFVEYYKGTQEDIDMSTKEWIELFNSQI